MKKQLIKELSLSASLSSIEGWFSIRKSAEKAVFKLQRRIAKALDNKRRYFGLKSRS